MFSTIFSAALSSSLSTNAGGGFDGGSLDRGHSPNPHSLSPHSPKRSRRRSDPLDGAVPVSFPPGMEALAEEVRGHLDAGFAALSDVFDTEAISVEAILVADEDWKLAPRENESPYPPGLPYFTRSTEPPTLVLPERLSPAIRPRTEATLPLTIWHELAHAFLLQNPLVKTPVWLREFVPQTASAAVAKREGLPLEAHLEMMDENPGFAVRSFRLPATAEEQMAFQNLLLRLGTTAIEEFGEGFLHKLVHELWADEDVVGEERAEAMLAESLGSGGEAWLEGREEF